MTLARFVTEREFRDLPTYQWSEPTGVYVGKHFKRRYGWTWYELEYIDIGKEDRVGIKYTPLLVYADLQKED